MASRKLASALMLLALLPGLAPLDAQQARDRFEGTTSVVLVEVPVYVTRAGQPVKGLRAENFQVLEGRKELPIVGFEVVDLTTVTAAAAPQQRQPTTVPIAARRHFLFLFDLLFSDVGSLARAREAALSFVREQMHPADLGAVVLNGARGSQLVLGFTSDRRQVELALQTLGAPQLVDRNVDPLALTLIDPGTSASEAGTGAAAAAEALEEHLRSIAGIEERAQRTQTEGKVVATTRSLADIATMIGAIEGRKFVIYLSEGIPGSLLTGSAGLEPQSAQDRGNLESGAIWDVDTNATFGSGRTQNQMQEMLEQFRRADAMIHAIDIGGLRAASDERPRADGRESLLMMAKDTGGELYENANDLGASMQRVQERTAVTYLLSVQPSNLELDGKYHKLKVRLVGAEGEVFHRQGFFAPDPGSPKSAMVQQIDLGQEILGGEAGGELGADVLAAAFPNGAKGYVPVLVEIDGKSLLAGHKGPAAPAEIYAYAIDTEGRIAGYFTHTIGLDLARVRGQVEQSGVKYFAHLDLPPGRYSLRVLVRNGMTGRSRLVVTPLRVPEFASDMAVSALLVAEPQGKWLLVPESERPKVDYPFMRGQEPFIPAARPLLPASGETALQLVGYNLSDRVTVSGKALAADGREVPGVSVELAGREGGAGTLSRLQAKLQTQRLAAGDYTLEVTVTDGASGQAETASLPVRVVG